ncbi:hypothetical protein BJ742DRAFT_744946 [Cladochytrium replicatum]|nr:hypothetical protein BJ742DRAFT_744946 [Cladochytrium replicatum]
MSMEGASLNGHVGVLEWWIESDLALKRPRSPMRAIMTKLDPNWHKKGLHERACSRFALVQRQSPTYKVGWIYTERLRHAKRDMGTVSSGTRNIVFELKIGDSMDLPSPHGYSDVLEWWKLRNGLELKHDRPMAETSRSGQVHELRWCMESVELVDVGDPIACGDVWGGTTKYSHSKLHQCERGCGLDLKWTELSLRMALTRGHANVLNGGLKAASFEINSFVWAMQLRLVTLRHSSGAKQADANFVGHNLEQLWLGVK